MVILLCFCIKIQELNFVPTHGSISTTQAYELSKQIIILLVFVLIIRVRRASRVLIAALLYNVQPCSPSAIINNQ